MNVENKVSFGEDSLKIQTNIKIWDVEELLTDKNYSVPRTFNNYTHQLIPNDGKHNLVRINLLSPQTITWFYTSSDGREQTKGIIDYFRDLFEKGEKQ
ncbi:MAG: hypothetical protein NTZ83_00095 [Candidatus Pacearchaeota archaeon]|nr:hypothetical protein [Candidatus Pacearchaeota archaeon]